MGTIRSTRVTVTTAAGAIPNIPLVILFGSEDAQEVVLRGIAQVLAVNLNGATVVGGTFDIDVTWTEE